MDKRYIPFGAAKTALSFELERAWEGRTKDVKRVPTTSEEMASELMEVFACISTEEAFNGESVFDDFLGDEWKSK